jgi:hypothetical protein
LRTPLCHPIDDRQGDDLPSALGWETTHEQSRTVRQPKRLRCGTSACDPGARSKIDVVRLEPPAMFSGRKISNHLLCLDLNRGKLHRRVPSDVDLVAVPSDWGSLRLFRRPRDAVDPGTRTVVQEID